MKRLASTLPNMMLSLVIVTALSGALLGGMYALTKKPIEEARQNAVVSAIAKVAPEFDNDPVKDAVDVEIAGNRFTIYPTLKEDKLTGAAVEGRSMNGFAGEIVVMCGFTADGTVKDYQVIQQGETPGLGTRMQEWFRDPAGARSVLGRNPGRDSFYVTKDKEHHGSVDAITAATISSRAFLETMRNAYEAYKDYSLKSSER